MPVDVAMPKQNTANGRPMIKSTTEEMNAATGDLQLGAVKWAKTTPSERLTLLDATIKNWASLLDEMVELTCKAKNIENTIFSGEEWLLGPYILMKNLRVLRRSLSDIVKHGKPVIPGSIQNRQSSPNQCEQLTAQVFPQTIYDRILFFGMTMEVWMQPGITKQQFLDRQASTYDDKKHNGSDCKVQLVMGSGNFPAMGPVDILCKLFVEGDVVLFKNHPVTSYMEPLFRKGFKELIESCFLRIVSGGPEESVYLCNNSGVNSIYMVGSDKTYEAIMFGQGEEGALRKSKRDPILKKPFKCELGNVSPYIIVPGPWKQSDFTYHADLLATCLSNNAGFNCVTPRVIIQQKSWNKRQHFLDGLRKVLRRLPSRAAYYPGAFNRHALFIEKHPEAELYSERTETNLPWTLIPDLDYKNDSEFCFKTEPFCSVVSETAIDANNTIDYFEKVVDFCNNKLWGTLGAMIIVHPDTLKDKTVADAFEQMIDDLKYGIVSLNTLVSSSYALALSPWGGYPGSDIADIQSGNGISNNALMLSDTQKTVIRAPFIIKPTPGWYISQSKKTSKLFKKLAELEASPSIMKLP
ncbi:MAG: aldehyde dehydrogenase family protein [Rubrobacteridae bacterium]|nr:aldehyde dehydrogenase family protein [Rubrobacteridae bacterium]